MHIMYPQNYPFRIQEEEAKNYICDDIDKTNVTEEKSQASDSSEIMKAECIDVPEAYRLEKDDLSKNCELNYDIKTGQYLLMGAKCNFMDGLGSFNKGKMEYNEATNEIDIIDYIDKIYNEDNKESKNDKYVDKTNEDNKMQYDKDKSESEIIDYINSIYNDYDENSDVYEPEDKMKYDIMKNQDEIIDYINSMYNDQDENLDMYETVDKTKEKIGKMKQDKEKTDSEIAEYIDFIYNDHDKGLAIYDHVDYTKEKNEMLEKEKNNILKDVKKEIVNVSKKGSDKKRAINKEVAMIEVKSEKNPKIIITDIKENKNLIIVKENPEVDILKLKKHYDKKFSALDMKYAKKMADKGISHDSKQVKKKSKKCKKKR